MTARYEPLNPQVAGAFRLFTLFPSPQYDFPLIGTLDHASHLNSTYIAISYVWGSPKIVDNIYVNGGSLPIAENLSKVLRSIRDTVGPQTLWIDAICINQADVEERNTHVQGMADIYRNAIKVLGYIGDRSNNADKGFKLFNDLKHTNQATGAIDTFLNQHIGNPSNDESWVAFMDFIDRPYWTRLWILQETAINKNVLLRVGTDSQDEFHIRDLYNWFWLKFSIIDKWHEVRKGSKPELLRRFEEVSNNLDCMSLVASFYPLRPEEFQPFLLLSIWNGPRATNPLDYIYSLFSLFEEHPLQVDYALTPRELFINVLEHEQHRSQKLDFLSWAWINYGPNSEALEHFNNTYNLPTYAVDWSRRVWSIWPDPLCYSTSDQRVMRKSPYRAAKDTTQRAHFDRNTDVMTLKGVIVAEIEAIGSIYTSYTAALLWPTDWNLVAGLGPLPSPHKTTGFRTDSPSMDVWYTGRSALEPYQLDTLWRTILGDRLSDTVRIRGTPDEEIKIPPRSYADLERVCEHMTAVASDSVRDGRRLYRTVDGNIGLGPPSADTGDLICAFHGGDVLYVLRRRKHSAGYEFKGECYLHNNMDGQWLGRNPNERSEVTFRILP